MKKKLRPATAMIELIFALVIMGIVLMSAPQLISTSAKSGFVTIQQEGINEASSQVNMVMGYYWDEADTNETFPPPVLHVSNSGNSDLNESATSGLRKGTPRLSKRSFIRADAQEFSATTSLGSDAGDRDDIDDFIGDTNLTSVTASNADYTESDTINIHTTVTYMSDAPSGNTYSPSSTNIVTFSPNFTTLTPTTNIKHITVTLTSTAGIDELDKKIVFNAFSCNIGAAVLEER
jgi:hypothetical protein